MTEEVVLPEWVVFEFVDYRSEKISAATREQALALYDVGRGEMRPRRRRVFALPYEDRDRVYPNPEESPAWNKGPRRRV